MRTKVIIDGLNNTQRFRAIINGVVIGDCQVKDLLGSRFGQREQRIAVWNALMEIAMGRRIGGEMVGFATTTNDGVNIQVDLV
jgi:hypothetical protein